MTNRLHTARILATVAALTAAAGSLAACNTVAGAGKDVSAVGHATTNTANDVKNNP
jgi:predicted small secreted protein